jgi:hypothetical protein
MSAANHNQQRSALMEKTFGEEGERELLAEDNEALRNVSALLTFIIAIGVMIALVAIVLTVFLGWGF